MTSANRGVSHKTVAAWLSVLELLKRRFHQGPAFNLHCWHNNSGEELDVIVEHGQRMMPNAKGGVCVWPWQGLQGLPGQV